MKRERFLTSSQVSDWLTPTIQIPSRPSPPGTAYVSAVIADTPLRYWRFEEASGAYVTTYGPSTATVIGSPTRAEPGGVGSERAVGFPTTSDYVQLDATGNLPGSSYRSSFSWECWFKVPTLTNIATGQGSYQLMGTDCEVASFTQRSWGMSMARTTAEIGKVWVFAVRSGSYASQLSTGRLDDGLWHHAVGTYNGALLSLYVDGVLQGSTAATGDVSLGVNPPAIGLNYGGLGSPNVFPGLVDEVAIYGTPLSAARVLAHYQAASA